MECGPTNGCCALTLNPKTPEHRTSSISRPVSLTNLPRQCRTDAVMHHASEEHHRPPPLTKKFPFHFSHFIYDTEGRCPTRTAISVTAFISTNTRQQMHLYLVSLLEQCVGFLGIIDGSPPRYGKPMDHAFVKKKTAPGVTLVCTPCFTKAFLRYLGVENREDEDTAIQ